MERRTSERAPCRTTVRVFQPDAPIDEGGSTEALLDWFFLESTDIGAGGVFLETDLLFPVGEELDLEFEVPGRPGSVRGRGEVVRVVVDGTDPGVAVQLKGLSMEERRALSRMSDLTRRRQTV